MDAVTLAAAKAALAGPLVPRRSNGVAFLGNSLMANGMTPTPLSLTTTADAAVGAVSLTTQNPYSAYPSQASPTVNTHFVIEPGTSREEHFLASAVTGTGPWTLTVPALTYAHASGSQVRTFESFFGAKSISWWTTLLSGHRLRYAGTFAHGSYTSAQVATQYLPQILALNPLPGAVVMCEGTNDNYSLTNLPTVTGMMDALVRRGILPIVCGAPPQNATVSTSSKIITKWNLALARACEQRGVPFIDIFTTMADDGSGISGAGGYKTTYNYDNTHPSEIGAKVWAQSILSALQAWWPWYAEPAFPSHNNYNGDGAAYPIGSGSNAVLLTDTNADGIPDNWSVQNSGSGTFTLVTRTGIPGKMWSLTRTANATTDPIATSSGFTIVPGHKYRWLCRIETSGVDAAYNALATTTGGAGGNTASTFAGFDVRITTNSADTDAMPEIKTWNREIPAGSIMGMDFTAPLGLSTVTCQVRMQLRGSALTPSYTVIVQPWLIDLTAASA